MGKKSKDKGGRGEREASKLLTKLLGIDFIRGCQNAGGPDTPDVKTTTTETTLHVEVKRDESTIGLRLYAALAQANRDAGIQNIPFVMSRRNNKEWVFAITETNLLNFCKEVVRIYEINE